MIAALGIVMASAMVLAPVAADTSRCKPRVVLQTGGVFNAESLSSESGWLYIHLDNDAVLGLREDQILEVGHQCCPLAEGIRAERLPWIIRVTPTADRDGYVDITDGTIRGGRVPALDDSEPPVIQSSPVVPTDHGFEIERARRRVSWWQPKSDFAKHDVYLHPDVE